MGWETRGSGSYYYRKRRIGKQVFSEYVGSGPFAEAISVLDELRRKEQALERQKRQEQREAIRAVDAKMDEICNLVQALRDGVLISAGYRAHKGQWRKKRHD